MHTPCNIYLHTDPDNESKFEIKKPIKAKATKTELKLPKQKLTAKNNTRFKHFLESTKIY